MSDDDTPDEVWRDMLAAHALTPVGQPARPRDVPAWWEAYAAASRTEAAALQRLIDWATRTHQPAAVVSGLVTAVQLLKVDARRSLREAADARRDMAEQEALT